MQNAERKQVARSHIWQILWKGSIINGIVLDVFTHLQYSKKNATKTCGILLYVTPALRSPLGGPHRVIERRYVAVPIDHQVRTLFGVDQLSSTGAQVRVDDFADGRLCQVG